MVAPHNNGRLTRSLVRIPGSGSCRAAGAVYQDFSRVSGVAAMVAAQHPPPQAMMQAQHRSLSRGSSNMDAAFFRKMAANVGTLPEAAGVEIGGTEARWARREAADVRSGTPAGVASRRPAGVGAAPPSGPTSAQPAGDPTPYGTQRKRLRPQPSEGNGEAVVPPQAKAPKVVYMAVPVVGGAGATSPTPGRLVAAALVPTPSEGAVAAEGDDGRPAVRMVAAGRPFVLSGESMKQLLDERNQLLQENQALSQRVQAFQQLFRNRNRLTSVLRTLGLTVV